VRADLAILPRRTTIPVWSALFHEAVAGSGERMAVTRIARQLGVGPESLRKWVMQVEIDGGSRAGVSNEDKAWIQELEST